MFFEQLNNSFLITKRMKTTRIMRQKELTPKDLWTLIAFLMNFHIEGE